MPSVVEFTKQGVKFVIWLRFVPFNTMMLCRHGATQPWQLHQARLSAVRLQHRRERTTAAAAASWSRVISAREDRGRITTYWRHCSNWGLYYASVHRRRFDRGHPTAIVMWWWRHGDVINVSGVLGHILGQSSSTEHELTVHALLHRVWTKYDTYNCIFPILTLSYLLCT